MQESEVARRSLRGIVVVVPKETDSIIACLKVASGNATIGFCLESEYGRNRIWLEMVLCALMAVSFICQIIVVFWRMSMCARPMDRRPSRTWSLLACAGLSW